MSEQITILGLGAMGIALSSKYLEHSYETTVWNRSTGKAAPLVAKGARLASTIAEALEASNTIIICVLDNSAARRLSDWVSTAGANYIHGGIMAVPIMIGTPHAMLLYSGPSTESFNRIESDLAILGTSKFLGTDAGSASLYDLALLSGMYGLFSGFFHATALAKSQGKITATGFLQLLTPWLTGMLHYLGPLAQQIDDGDFATQGSNLAMQLVGIENICSSSEEQGVSSNVILPIKRLVEKAVENGHGGSDLSALIEYFSVREA